MNSVLSETNGSFLIGDLIKGPAPIAIGKIGHTEFRTIYFNKFNTDIRPNRDLIFTNCGVFPNTHASIMKFLDVMYESLPLMDVLPVHAKIEGFIESYNLPKVPKDYENNLILKYSPNCKLVKLRSLEPYYFNNPWSQNLAGKKVLVVSPFIESINKQYSNRNKIWDDSRILPEFELIGLHHQFSPSLTGFSEFKDWNQMVNSMKDKISKIDFDIALIGTGASSIPLAAHCKLIGKKAIHMGGSLQILFGIKGARWNDHLIGKNFYKDSWIFPSILETPKLYKENEKGCYW